MKRFLILFTLLYSNICFSSTEFSIFKKKFNIAESEALNKFDEGYMPIEEKGKKDFYISAGVGKLHFSNLNYPFNFIKGNIEHLTPSKEVLDALKAIPEEFTEFDTYINDKANSNKTIKSFIQIINTGLKISGEGFNTSEVLEKVAKFTHKVKVSELEGFAREYYSKIRGILVLPTILSSIRNTHIDYKQLASVSLGSYIGDNYRLEFEVFGSKINLNVPFNGNMYTPLSTYLFGVIPTLYRDYNIKNTPFNLHFGMGYGPAIFAVDIKDTNNESFIPIPIPLPSLALKSKLGVDYSVNQRTKISLGYRFLYMPMISLLGITTHNIEAGLTFYF